MQVAFKPTFHSVTFDSNMCRVYFTKEKVDFFLVRPLNIQWSLCYNFIHVYFIKFSNEKAGLNTILTNQFQTYLFPTFIIPKILKFFSWFTINPIEGSIVSKGNLSKLWIYFLVFSWKTVSFLTWFFFSNFLCILYHAFTYLQWLGQPISWTYALSTPKWLSWRNPNFQTRFASFVTYTNCMLFGLQ